MERPTTAAAKAATNASVQAPQTPPSARRSSRAAGAASPAASKASCSTPSARRGKGAAKQEPTAAGAADAAKAENSTDGAMRGSKRKLDAAAGAASAVVKAEPGTTVPQQQAAKAKPPRQRTEVKQEPADHTTVKQEPQLAAVKQEPLNALRPSGSIEVKVEGWAARADAAQAAAEAGKVDLGEAPTAAPLGPFPDFKRPLPDECQVSP